MLCAIWVLSLGGRAHAESSPSVRIEVRGGSQIDGAAWVDAGGFGVRGVLADDAGAVLAGAEVSIQLLAAAGARALSMPAPERCVTGGKAPRRAASDRWVLQTDDRGAFCARGSAAAGAGVARVRFASTALHEGAELDVALEARVAEPAAMVLRFDPVVERLDLDRPTQLVTASLVLDPGTRSSLAPGLSSERGGFTVSLEDERGEKLGEAMTGGDGRARFEIATTAFDGPGLGELRLRFDGREGLSRAAAVQPVVRSAEAKLSVPSPPSRADPGAGIGFDVELTSTRGAVSGGVVEALLGGKSVGAATVEAGRARLTVSFPAPQADSAELTLRYSPAAPWWRAGPDATVTVPLAGPSLLRYLLPAALVLAIAGWVLKGWRRAPKGPVRVETTRPTGAPTGRAGVTVLEEAGPGGGFWGIITDAHDGAPVAGARVAIEVPSFAGTGVLASSISDEQGAFSLEGTARPEARLVVGARLYRDYEQALPSPGRLGISLVTRRRALVERLVRWARRHGAPYDGRPEPTPGHVRRAASRAGAESVESWASQLEGAAFGPGDVDGETEQQIRKTEPRPVP